MVAVAKLALLLLVAPAAPDRCEALSYKPFRSRRWSAQQRPFALPKASSEDGLDQAGPRTCSSGCSAETSHESSAGSTESLRGLSLVRGGDGGDGGGDDTPVFTLLVRVFIPSFGRKNEVKQGGLDLEGGGLMRRLGRLMSGVWRKVPGFSRSTKETGEEAKAASKKKGKGKETSKSHLETTYRPGNANYRIQKELKEFMTNPPDNCRVSVGKNIRVWIITISGSEGTVYAGEKFRLRVAFPDDYPTKPPAVYFLQSPPPPKHQHIYTNGDICLSLLSSRDWKPNLTVMSLALSILSMLSSAKEKRIPEDNAAHANARPGQAQQWVYHDDSC